jgi:hypothetical protein
MPLLTRDCKLSRHQFDPRRRAGWKTAVDHEAAALAWRRRLRFEGALRCNAPARVRRRGHRSATSTCIYIRFQSSRSRRLSGRGGGSRTDPSAREKESNCLDLVGLAPATAENLTFITRSRQAAEGLPGGGGTRSAPGESSLGARISVPVFATAQTMPRLRRWGRKFWDALLSMNRMPGFAGLGISLWPFHEPNGSWSVCSS